MEPCLWSRGCVGWYQRLNLSGHTNAFFGLTLAHGCCYHLTVSTDTWAVSIAGVIWVQLADVAITLLLVQIPGLLTPNDAGLSLRARFVRELNRALTKVTLRADHLSTLTE